MSFKPDAPVVWAELPVSDIDAGVAFYSAVFGYDLTIDTSGPNPVAFLPYGGPGNVAGHIYPGKPAAAGTGPTVHLMVPDTVEETLARCEAAGGKTQPDIVPLPGGRFGYATDPDGNSLGFFEPAA